jgi:lysozyme family protein
MIFQMTYPDIFNKCIEVILDNEGGYVNHPDDPGGETNMGITKSNYPNEDIKNLTRDKAIHYYFRDYWTPMNLELLSDPLLILHVFDHGVNAGPKTAIKLLQRLVGAKDDGDLGPKTKASVETYPGDVVEEYIKRRKLFYVTLVQNKPSLRVFIKGWLARIERTKFK